MSHQRRLILEELRSRCAHPSADEVYDWVRVRLPRISLGTVYRNLDILAELGEIKKLELSGTVKRFDGRLDHHYHIRCTCCDRVDDAPLAPRVDIERELVGETPYKIIGHRLEFIGLCPICAREMIAPGFARLRSRALRGLQAVVPPPDPPSDDVGAAYDTPREVSSTPGDPEAMPSIRR
jgi:Fur family ferric uptake transcriptional regulator